jgi:hypothetical protein
VTVFGKRPLGRPYLGSRSYTDSFAVEFVMKKRVKVKDTMKMIKVLDCFAMIVFCVVVSCWSSFCQI